MARSAHHPAAAIPAILATPEAPTDGDRAASIDERLPITQRKILSVLVQYPSGRRKNQVALLAGYAVSGGGFNNALSALRSRGRIAGTKESLHITDDGLAVLGTWAPLPTGHALVEHWLGTLAKAERAILQALVAAYPATLTKEALGRATGYEPSGGGFNNALRHLRTLDLIAGRGDLRASDTLCAPSWA